MGRFLARIERAGRVTIDDQELSLLVLRGYVMTGVGGACHWDRIALKLSVVSRCHWPKLASFTIPILCDVQLAFILS